MRIKLFENFESDKKDFYNIEGYDDPYEWVDIDDISVYKEFDRPLKHDLVASIQTDGFTQPLIMHYSKEYCNAYLVEGNHRLKAAKYLGIKYVPVRVTTDGGSIRDAHYVVCNIKNPTLPSQIGFEAYDNSGEQISINENKIKLFDPNKYPDIISCEIKDGYYDIHIDCRLSDISHIFDDNMFENYIDVLENDISSFIRRNYPSIQLLVDMIDDSSEYGYLNKDIVKLLKIEDKTYSEYREYFFEEFTETEYFKPYLTEVKKLIFEKYRSINHIKNDISLQTETGEISFNYSKFDGIYLHDIINYDDYAYPEFVSVLCNQYYKYFDETKVPSNSIDPNKIVLK
jgi:hypothetical protein